MKWLLLLVLLLPLLLLPTVASAGGPVIVTITGWGYVVVGPPGSLTLAYVTDYEIDVSWTKGVSAVDTLVRAKYNSAPTSTTDGYFVYYGPGTSAADTTVNLVQYPNDEVFYNAWSRNSGGSWSLPTTSSIGGVVLLAIAIMIMVLGITGLAFAKRSLMLHAVAVVMWFVGGYVLYNQTYPGNTYIPTAVLFAAYSMVLVHTVSIVQIAISGRSHTSTYEEEKAILRSSIARRTQRKRKPPWQI